MKKNFLLALPVFFFLAFSFIYAEGKLPSDGDKWTDSLVGWEYRAWAPPPGDIVPQAGEVLKLSEDSKVGKYSIAIRQVGGLNYRGVLYLPSPVDVSDYSKLRLWVKTDRPGSYFFVVRLRTTLGKFIWQDASNKTDRGDYFEYKTETFEGPINEWKELVVPIKDFKVGERSPSVKGNPSLEKINYIVVENVFQKGKGNDKSWTYIDGLRFEK